MQDESQLKRTYSFIPKDCDVLITHTPVFGILDKCPESAGSIELKNALKRNRNIVHHIFGHIHENFGEHKKNNRHFHNVAMCDDYNNLIHKNPQIIQLDN